MKSYDPSSLKNRVAMVDFGLQASKDEKGQSLNKCEIMRNISEYQKIMVRKSHYRFSIILTTIQTSNHLLRLSLRQWATYLMNCEKWMCMFLSDSTLPYSFKQLSPMGEAVISNTVSSVQQVRNLYLHEVQKIDIWDTKNCFRNEINRIIFKENCSADSMERLEVSVL